MAKEEFCRRNEEASEQRCWAVLRELWLDMELRMQRGDYVAPGETRLFLKDLKRMQEEYKRRPDKGVKVSRVGAMGAVAMAVPHGGTVRQRQCWRSSCG